eukprot:UN06296
MDQFKKAMTGMHAARRMVTVLSHVSGDNSGVERIFALHDDYMESRPNSNPGPALCMHTPNTANQHNSKMAHLTLLIYPFHMQLHFFP